MVMAPAAVNPRDAVDRARARLESAKAGRVCRVMT